MLFVGCGAVAGHPLEMRFSVVFIPAAPAPGNGASATRRRGRRRVRFGRSGPDWTCAKSIRCRPYAQLAWPWQSPYADAFCAQQTLVDSRDSARDRIVQLEILVEVEVCFCSRGRLGFHAGQELDSVLCTVPYGNGVCA